MKKITIISIITFVIIISLYILQSNVLFKISFFDTLKSKIPYEIKHKLLKTIFIFKYAENLEKELKNKNKIINEKNYLINQFSNKTSFYFKSKKKFENTNIEIKYFENEKFISSGPRAYFAKDKSNLIIITGTGSNYYTNFDNFNNPGNKIDFKTIKNNLNELLGNEYILDYLTIVKGIEVINNKIYASVVIKKNDKCFSNAILQANLNYQYLEYKIFFDSMMCIPYFSYQSGGNISAYKDDKILLTTGDWFYADNKKFPLNSTLSPQNKDDLLGKIIAIDLNDPSRFNIVALGSRNAQGLFYDSKNDLIFSSEHGPQGGDEINLIKNSYKGANLGWPVSSYGDHYGFPEFKGEFEGNNERYERASLEKSHKVFGFIEPLKYFPKESPGASQLIKLNKFENYKEDLHVIYFGTMGDSNYGSKSIFKFIFDENFQLIEEKKYFINERVRDIIYLEKYNKILLFLETTGSIGILENLKK